MYSTLEASCLLLFCLADCITVFVQQESVHNHVIMETFQGDVTHDQRNNSDSAIKEEGHVIGITRDNAQVKKVPLWKNQAMMAAIFVYCLWGLHDMAYSEVYNFLKPCI